MCTSVCMDLYTWECTDPQSTAEGVAVKSEEVRLLHGFCRMKERKGKGRERKEGN